MSYPREVGWRVSRDKSYLRVPSTAAQGNILEAINIALNVMQLHYVDRDLHRSGNSVVIISAGSGVFEVDKDLAGITKQRMMDNGIGEFCSVTKKSNDNFTGPFLINYFCFYDRE